MLHACMRLREVWTSVVVERADRGAFASKGSRCLLLGASLFGLAARVWSRAAAAHRKRKETEGRRSRAAVRALSAPSKSPAPVAACQRGGGCREGDARRAARATAMRIPTRHSHWLDAVQQSAVQQSRPSRSALLARARKSASVPA